MDAWVEVALEEYRSLRQESLEAIQRLQQIAQYGLATAGVAVSAAVIASAEDSVLGALVLISASSGTAGLLSRRPCQSCRLRWQRVRNGGRDDRVAVGIGIGRGQGALGLFSPAGRDNQDKRR